MSIYTEIHNHINLVPDFPKIGINFRDISPLLANYGLREKAIDLMFDLIKNNQIDYVAGIDSRGFIFGMGLAQRLKCGFIMIRKPNKMPNTVSISYDLEYETDTLTIQKGIMPFGSNVLIVDDLFATGGTIEATIKLINHEEIKCNVVDIICLINLFGMKKRDFGHFVKSILSYNINHKKDDMPIVSRFIDLEKTSFVDKEDEEKIIVFSHPSMKEFAKNIIESNPEKFRSGFIEWAHFPDGYPNIKFEHMRYLDGKHVIFVASIFDSSKFLEELSMMMVLPRQLIKSFDIILPYFAPGTMERVEEEGILVTAETVAKIISTCMPPLARGGLPVLHIFDLHALPVRFYFTDNVCIKLESTIPLLKERLSTDFGDNIVIAFPDDGAFKRFKSMFRGYKIIVCSKIREGIERKIKVSDCINIPAGFDLTTSNSNVVIVDDLVQTGGTLNECKKALKNMGIKNISCYVTHAIFPHDEYKKFMTDDTFDKFYITNSIPEVAKKLGTKNHLSSLDWKNILVNFLFNLFSVFKLSLFVFEKKEFDKLFKK